ncbi:5-oxoprolinase subunit B family protein [Mangrovicoccus algicola]|uniref:Carboxyltransferase domain-containing protein n=1 Tax=Mangrovicoccus algicola TaxID=2771008 RepID=A0A8J6Z2E3_9RHOB|nr:carboxyltransferase domain-containing protein [Mangrovicoccus algicola]MBE3640448.1 carboxyltransferase domain-containing protein [Mangrovicoccus algicola]
MTRNTALTPEALPSGADGMILRFALRPGPEAMAAAARLAQRLEAAPPAGMVEICPALVSVFLRFDPARSTRRALAEAVLAEARALLRDPPAPPEPLRRWHLPVCFGGSHGPQLGEAARLAGLSETAAVAQLCAADLRVLAIGFAPGQPYLGLLPEAWGFPRMSELNPSVPQGAVTVAVRQLVIFAAQSATGWRSIGRTAMRPFQPGRETPVPLRAGDAIRLSPVAPGEFDALAEAADGMGGARPETLR